MGRPLDTLVADYLKDEFGQVWLLQVPAFTFVDGPAPHRLYRGTFVPNSTPRTADDASGLDVTDPDMLFGAAAGAGGGAGAAGGAAAAGGAGGGSNAFSLALKLGGVGDAVGAGAMTARSGGGGVGTSRRNEGRIGGEAATEEERLAKLCEGAVDLSTLAASRVKTMQCKFCQVTRQCSWWWSSGACCPSPTCFPRLAALLPRLPLALQDDLQDDY